MTDKWNRWSIVLGSGNWEGNTDKADRRLGWGGNRQSHAEVGQPSRASLMVSTEEGLG